MNQTPPGSIRLLLIKTAAGLGIAVLTVYFGIAILVTAVVQWRTGDDPRYDTGIIGWLITGKAGVGTKGLLWPYSLYVSQNLSPSERQKEAVHRLKPLIDGAARVGREGTKYQNSPLKSIPLSSLEEAHQLSERILREGPRIDVDALNAVYPELGTYFSTKFLVFIQLTHESIQELLKGETVSGRAKSQHATQLELEWDGWMNSHRVDINQAIRSHW